MKRISIEVSDGAAVRFSNMSEKEKASLNNLLTEIIEDERTLFEVIDDMSAYAAKNGLTLEKLNKILNKE